MTRPHTPEAERIHDAFDAVWGSRGFVGTMTLVNHTSIGLRFMVTGGVFFLVGGLFAMLIRTQLALPGLDVLSPDAYNQAFTMHGSVMMFLFAVPILEGLAVYLLPKMLGARDLVFPRLSALGYWAYLFGGLILLSSVFLGVAPDGGWFLYTPLSSAPHSPGPNPDFWLIGITFAEISAVAAGVELVVAVLRTRAPGMTLDRMPVFAWYILVVGLMIVVGFPPLILGSILLELERAAGMPFFDVARGGDPVLWQHLFWLFGHPEVYIIFLPAAGIVSTLIPVFAQRPLVGYTSVVLSVIATGFISFALWVHHMFTVGIPQLAQAFFSAASMLVAIPTGVQVFAWIATLWLGRPIWHVPMLWLTGFLVVFVAGGLTGVMLALVPFDWQVHDTHFVVAHLHYVLVGGMFFPLVAGLYYWLPHFSGRMPSARLGRTGFWLVFVGFNLTFLVMHWTGMLGMPRRVFTYEEGLGWDVPNLVSSIGSFILAIGTATVLADIALHFFFGRRAATNPWNADTLEWATAIPPDSYNFATLPAVDGRHPMWERPDLPYELAHGKHGLPEIGHGRRETWGIDPLSGRIREVVHLPGNTWLPLVVAGLLAGVCVSLLAKAYPLAVAFAAASAVAVLRWSWENGAHPRAAPENLPVHESYPLHSRTFDGPGLWGMHFTLLADGALYASLLFSWFYLWTVAPTWQAPVAPGPDGMMLFASAALLTVAALVLSRFVARLRRRNGRGLAGGLVAVVVLGLVQTALLVALLRDPSLEPTANSHDALVFVVLAYATFHCVIATVVTALQPFRVRLGYVGVRTPYEPAVLLRLWYYNVGVLWAGYVALVLFPSA